MARILRGFPTQSYAFSKRKYQTHNSIFSLDCSCDDAFSKLLKKTSDLPKVHLQPAEVTSDMWWCYKPTSYKVINSLMYCAGNFIFSGQLHWIRVHTVQWYVGLNTFNFVNQSDRSVTRLLAICGKGTSSAKVCWSEWNYSTRTAAQTWKM